MSSLTLAIPTYDAATLPDCESTSTVIDAATGLRLTPENLALSRRIIAIAGTDAVKISSPLWSDASVDWREFDLVLVRETWDYHHSPTKFREWVRSLKNVANSALIIEWNMDKSIYLPQLQSAGVAIVPTLTLTASSLLESVDGRRDGPITLSDLDVPWNTTKHVVKPSISASAALTTLVETATDIRFHLQEISERGYSVLIQPFVDSIKDQGETSLVYIQGRLSHAIIKRPASNDFRVQEEYGGRNVLLRNEEIDDGLVQLGEKALDTVCAICEGTQRSELLYGRIDCVRYDSKWVLMECELIEPSLYLKDGGVDAVERFARAVLDFAKRNSYE